MTNAEKDTAWRSLPEDAKEKARKEFRRHIGCNSSTGNDYCCGYNGALKDFFGAHNLTAAEDEIQDKTMEKGELLKSRKERGKQTLNIGDKVRAISASGKPLYDGKVATIIEKGMLGDEVYYGLYIEGVTVENRSAPLIGKSEIIYNTSRLAPYFAEDLELVARRDIVSTKEGKPMFKVGDMVVTTTSGLLYGIGWTGMITHIEGNYAAVRMFTDNEITFKADMSHLAPCIKEQEPKNDDCDDSSSSLQNEIPSMSKEDAEELAKCLAAVEDFVKEYKDSQVDWLAYRMELTKEVAAALIGKGHEIAFVAESTSLIVDGIVERLKGVGK